MGLGSSRAGDQDTVLWLDGCFCGPSPKCIAVMNTTGHTRWENPLIPSTTLSTCSQQLRAISSMQEKSYLKVNQPVTGEGCVCGRVPICPSVCPTLLAILKHSNTKPTTGENLCLHVLRGPVITLKCNCAPRMKTSHCAKFLVKAHSHTMHYA